MLREALCLSGFRVPAEKPDSPSGGHNIKWICPWISVPFRPIIDRLAADENVRLSGGIAQLENFRKLLEGKARGYAHLDMARTTCLKLVMRHFAPLPTSEARR